MRRWLAPYQRGKILDLACGTGDVTFELAAGYPQGNVVGIDLTPAMIDVARGRAGSSRITFHAQDMCHTTVADAWADVVTGSYALRNAPVLDEAINRLGAQDQAALTLRFLEGRDLRSVGEALGSTEDAAQKRVARALEKLRTLLRHRGVTTSRIYRLQNSLTLALITSKSSLKVGGQGNG